MGLRLFCSAVITWNFKAITYYPAMRRGLCLGATILFCVAAACRGDDDDGDENSCVPDDADGIANIDVNVELTVDDAAFAPAIVKTQNTSSITLTLTNKGTRPHGFAIDCHPTPNTRGCPPQICFPPEATVAPLAPGASATVKFTTPAYEAIYTYRSTAEGDSALATGQFILQ